MRETKTVKIRGHNDEEQMGRDDKVENNVRVKKQEVDL